MTVLCSGSGRPGSMSRLKRRLMTVVGVVTAGIMLVGSPAHASVWQLNDDLNANPAATWSTWVNGAGTAGFTTSGANTFGHVTKTDTAGWTEIGRNVRITPRQLHSTSCGARIDLRASVDGSTSTANIEVIDPTTWNYVALRQVRVTGSNWQSFAVGPWRDGPVNVRFRVSLLGAGSYRYLGVDNLVMQCSY